MRTFVAAALLTTLHLTACGKPAVVTPTAPTSDLALLPTGAVAVVSADVAALRATALGQRYFDAAIAGIKRETVRTEVACVDELVRAIRTVTLAVEERQVSPGNTEGLATAVVRGPTRAQTFACAETLVATQPGLGEIAGEVILIHDDVSLAMTFIGADVAVAQISEDRTLVSAAGVLAAAKSGGLDQDESFAARRARVPQTAQAWAIVLGPVLQNEFLADVVVHARADADLHIGATVAATVGNGAQASEVVTQGLSLLAFVGLTAPTPTRDGDLIRIDQTFTGAEIDALAR